MNKNINSLAAVVAIFIGSVSVAQASTVLGVAVDGIGGSQIGNTLVQRSALSDFNDGFAIEYYIPISSGASGTFGDGNVGGDGGVGQVSDVGTADGTLSMFLEFAALDVGTSYELQIAFEDLDLIGANDPSFFFEAVEIFGQSNDGTLVSLTGLLDNIDSPLVSGDASTIQTVSFNLGPVSLDTYYLQLDFSSRSSRDGYFRNTPEYLVAQLTAVPLPAAAWMLLLGISALGLSRARRN